MRAALRLGPGPGLTKTRTTPKTKSLALAVAFLSASACATVHGGGTASGPLETVLGAGNDREARAAARAADRPTDAWARLARAMLARRAADPATEVVELLAAATAAPREAVALVALRRLAELADESPELSRAVEAGLAPPLAAGRFRGLAAYRARVARVAAADGLGDLEHVAALRGENGAVKVWTLAGPFGRRRARDFVATWPAESGVLPESVPAPWAGAPRPTRTLPAPDGSVVLDGEPSGGDVFILASDVTLARGGHYLVSLGSALSVRVTIDGVVVHDRRDFAGWLPTVVHVPVTLDAGAHRVVVKIARTGERGSFLLAFSREDGAPSDATSAPVRPGTPAAVAPRPDVGTPVYGARALAAALTSDAGGPGAALLAGLDAAGFDREGAKALLADAAAALPRSAAILWARALVVATDPTLDGQVAAARAEAGLREALALDPGHDAARLALASLLRRAGRLDETAELLAAAPTRETRGGSGPLPSPAPRGEGSAGTSPLPSPAPRGEGSAGTSGREASYALARARLAEARGLVEAAEAHVAEAIAAGAGCRALELGRELANRRRAVAVEDERVRAAAACRDGRERLADHLRRRDDLAGAAAALAPLVASRPWAVEPAIALAGIRVAAGDALWAVRTLQAVRQIWPRSGRVEKKLAEALELAGDAQGAREARERALLDDGGDLALRRRLAVEDGRELLDAWAEDAGSAIRAYQAARRTDDTSAALVLDAAAVEYHRGGAYTERTHQVIHVLDPHGVEQYGEATVPPGADVLVARTLKPDGRSLEPERVLRDGKGTISLAGLEPGDYVELEWLRADRGLGATVAADPFFFRSDGARLFLSRYVVAAPQGLGLAVDPHGVTTPAVTVEGGREVVRVEARDVPAHVREPGQPSMGEFMPHVQVGLGGDRAEIQADLADVFAPLVRPTEELRAFAREIRRSAGSGATPLALARAAWARVSKEILGAGEDSGPASDALSRGRGSRLLVLQAVLGELGVRARVALARPYASDATARRFPSHTGWPHALLRIEVGDTLLWHDPSYRLAPLGTIPSTVLGVEALVLAAPGEPLEVTRTPERSVVEDRRELAVSIALRADGGATVAGTESYFGASGAAAKVAIERLDRSDRRQVMEGMLARSFRGLALSEAEMVGEADPEGPVALRWKGTLGALARAADGGLVLDAPLLPARLAARFSPLATRTTALVIPAPEVSTQRIEIEVPQGLRPAAAAPARVESPYGTFTRTERVEGRKLVREERLELRRGRIPPDRYAEFTTFVAAVDLIQQRPVTFGRGEVAAAFPPPPPGGAAP
jgi:hypothetical protein